MRRRRKSWASGRACRDRFAAVPAGGGDVIFGRPTQPGLAPHTAGFLPRLLLFADCCHLADELAEGTRAIQALEHALGDAAAAKLGEELEPAEGAEKARG